MMHIFETLKGIAQAFHVHSLLLQMTIMAHFDTKNRESSCCRHARLGNFSFTPDLCKTDSCVSTSHSFRFQETSMLKE